VWPIPSPTYILLPTNPPADKVEASRNTMRFFERAFREGSQIASSVEYIPLQAAVHDLVRAAWARSVRTPAGQPVWS
jgi:phosphate transport system substrate-binding protein